MYDNMYLFQHIFNFIILCFKSSAYLFSLAYTAKRFVLGEPTFGTAAAST